MTCASSAARCCSRCSWRCAPGTADPGQLAGRRPHRRLRVLLRHRVVAHHRPHRLVVEPDLGHDDRDADPHLPDLRRARLDRRRLRARSRCRVGAIVCIAAANAGNTSQDLKTGYIVGATPLYQQIGLVIGVLASALVIGVTTLYLHQRVRRSGRTPSPAPQATLMATIIKGLLQPEPAVGPGARRRVRRRHARAVRHPLAVVRRRLLPADRDDGADLRRRPRALVGRAQDRRRPGVGPQRRHALQLGPDRRAARSAGILFAVLVGTETIGPFQAIGNALPWLHDENALGHIAGGLLFLAPGGDPGAGGTADD